MRRPLIRFAFPSDAEEISEIFTRTGVGTEHMEESENLVDLFSDNVLVAILDNRVVGVLFWIHGVKHAYIDTLAILPEYQNEGIGAWLMHELGFILKAAGIKHLYTATHPENGSRTRGMLVRLGYKDMGEVVGLRKEISGGGIYG